MSDQTQALGTLLIEISDLAGAAEDHGIVGQPPRDVLAPLIEQAQQLGVDVAPQATLADLHLAVELAAQVIAEQALEAGPPTATAPAGEAPHLPGQAFAVPSPQVSPGAGAATTRAESTPEDKI